MCIFMHSHALTHDVRPQIQHPFPDPSDPSASPTTIVNPYSEPTPCRFQADSTIAGYFKCAWHNCCRVVTRLVRCSRSSPCKCPVDYHRYEPRPLTTAAAESIAAAGGESEGWHPLPVIDSAIWYAEVVVTDQGSTVQRQPAAGAVGSRTEMARRAMYVSLAAAAAAAVAQLPALADRTRLADLAEHAICARVLNDFECSALRAHNRAVTAFRAMRRIVLDLLKSADDCKSQLASADTVWELDEWAAEGAGRGKRTDDTPTCLSEWTWRVMTLWPDETLPEFVGR